MAFSPRFIPHRIITVTVDYHAWLYRSHAAIVGNPLSCMPYYCYNSYNIMAFKMQYQLVDVK